MPSRSSSFKSKIEKVTRRKFTSSPNASVKGMDKNAFAGVKRRFSKLKRGEKAEVKQVIGINSFPGRMKNSKRSNPAIPDKTPGLFVQSIKGMKGKHFVEKGINLAMTVWKDV